MTGYLRLLRLCLPVALAAARPGLAETGPALAELIRQAEGQLAAGELDAAEKTIADLRAPSAPPDAAAAARISHLEGLAAFHRGDRETALARFTASVAAAPDPATRAALAYNAALASRTLGDAKSHERFASILAASAGPDSTLPGDLALEKALDEAAGNAATAFESLEAFIRKHPDHPRVVDAELSIAELYLTQVPPQPVAAADHIASARERSLTLSQGEWLDYVSLWVEVAAQNHGNVADRARRFFEQWPRSARRPSVLMVLGQSLYRVGRYPEAIDQFEALGYAFPHSPLAEQAFFFAGKAASFTLTPENRTRAADFWRRAAEKNGPLAAPALHEIGLLQLTSEDYDGAIETLESIAAIATVDPTLRIAAQTDLGEAFYAKAVATENAPATFEAAAAVFARIGADAGASKSWRLQAAVRQGKCLEALGRRMEALAIYDTAVREGAPTGPVAAVPMAEFDWYFRAGLAAIRLLQADQKWSEAVAIADRIAQSGGPRAADAARLGDSLRLRHFIWQNPAN